MKHITFTLTIFLITILVNPSAWTKDKILSFFENNKDKVNITANKIEARFIPDGYEVIFIGKVHGVQGPLSMTCDRLILYFKDKGAKRNAGSSKPSLHSEDLDNLRSAKANGNVTVVYKKTMAASEKLTYDSLKRTVTFTGGKPKMWQGPHAIIADMIIIYLDENRIDVKRGKDEPISFTINPSKGGKEKK